MTDRPNILILMVDQLNGTLFPDGPADWLHTPNLRRLADRSMRFANTYTGSPLCAPGRASWSCRKVNAARLSRGVGSRQAGRKAMAGGRQMAIGFKGVYYPKSVVLHAVFFYSATQSRSVTLKRPWPSAG